MSTLIVIIHVVVAVALILIVLLQTGKGADMGAAFGGGSSQTLFGSTGASSFLSRLTTAAAVVFMLTSLALAYLSGRGGMSSIMSEMPIPATQQTEGTVPDTPIPGEQAAPEVPLQTGHASSDETPAEPAAEESGQ